MPIPSERELLANAVHFGHRKEKWNPKIAPFLYGVHQGIHVFDLAITKERLEQNSTAIRALCKEGKTILFVCTKQQSASLVEELARSLNQPYVTKKWIPGLITNWTTLKKRLKYYLDLRQSFKSGEIEKYTKKEQMMLRKKLAKLDHALSGVSELEGPPDAVFIVDAVRDAVALKEAKKLGIPVYGICDSNADPNAFTRSIPGND